MLQSLVFLGWVLEPHPHVHIPAGDHLLYPALALWQVYIHESGTTTDYGAGKPTADPMYTTNLLVRAAPAAAGCSFIHMHTHAQAGMLLAVLLSCIPCMMQPAHCGADGWMEGLAIHHTACTCVRACRWACWRRPPPRSSRTSAPPRPFLHGACPASTTR